VLGEKDVIILKVITSPVMKDFDRLIVKARTEAKRSGLKKSSIQKIIKKIRKDK
jgi:hypothetical protein